MQTVIQRHVSGTVLIPQLSKCCTAQLCFNICEELAVKLDNEYYVAGCLVEKSHEGKVQKHRTNPNNKPEIIIHDTGKGKYIITDVAISGDRNVSFQKYKGYNRNTVHVERKNKSDSSNYKKKMKPSQNHSENT